MADPREGRGGRSPSLDWDQKKNFIARPKNTHLQTPFCMPESAKTHLQQSRIQNFPGEDPQSPDPPLQGRAGKGKGGTRGREREGGRGRIGKLGRGRTGRDRGGKEGRNGVGVGRARKGRSTCPPPLETSSGSAPAFTVLLSRPFRSRDQEHPWPSGLKTETETHSGLETKTKTFVDIQHQTRKI